MKKIVIILFVVVRGVSLSACSTKSNNSATDGGIYKSINFGETWTQKVFMSKTSEGTQTISDVSTQYMLFDPVDENTVYLMSQRNGLFKTTNQSDQWSRTGLTSTTKALLSIDTLNNDVLYIVQGKNIVKSVDGGIKWSTIYTESRPGQTLNSVLVDPFKSNIVYAASTTSLIQSFDYGITWELLEWTGSTIYKVYRSEKRPNVFYMWGKTGILVSADGTKTWKNITEEFDKKMSILALSFDPKSEDFLLGTKTGIVRSFDSGITWKTVPTLFDFKTVPISTVAQNPVNTREIMFSASNKLHKTDDGGKTWRVFKTVPTSRTINYLISDPYHRDTIYLGTYRAPSKK